MYQDVVALVPGFLGFGHFGGFYYFADRVAATLRGALESQAGRSIPVIPFSTLPAAGLPGRQEFLLGSLARLDAMMPGIERFHLVGHSAGGVDAYLLTCDRPFGGAPPDPRGVRKRIRSVVTIGSPHYGTGLANTDFAQFLNKPFAHINGLPALGKAVLDILRSAPNEQELPATVTSAFLDWRQTFTFLGQVLQQRDLIQALQPERMADLQMRCRHDPEVPSKLTCFVTATAAPSDDPTKTDALYRDLYGLTAKGAKNLGSAAREAERRLRAVRDDEVLKHPEMPRPTFDDSTNDGIVTSICQIARPHVAEEFGGVVVADHGDVLGHYPRVDPLTSEPKKAIHPGLFHSGAGFRDDEFFAFLRRVAKCILDAR